MTDAAGRGAGKPAESVSGCQCCGGSVTKPRRGPSPWLCSACDLIEAPLREASYHLAYATRILVRAGNPSAAEAVARVLDRLKVT